MNIVKFADVAHRANTKEDRFATDKIYYVGGEHIETNELVVHHKGIIKGSTIGPMFYCGFKSGQILFVTRNPHLRKCSIAYFDGICSEKTFVIESTDKRSLLQEYLALVMQSNDFWDYCEENKSGGVNYFVNWSTLAEYEFELPPLAEQKKLVEKVLSAYRLKESYKHLLTATQEMVKSRLPEPVGRACSIPGGIGKSITAVDCTIVRLNDKVLPEFFIAFTNTPYYAMQIKKVLSGTTRLRISRANLGKIQVPLPSKDRQKQFVAIVEQSDKSVFEIKKSIEAIDAVIKSLINS